MPGEVCFDWPRPKARTACQKTINSSGPKESGPKGNTHGFKQYLEREEFKSQERKNIGLCRNRLRHVGGRAYLFTTYDAYTAGNVVNQVQRDFNGLGQFTKEYQSHSGAVNTGTTPKVQYAYSEMTGGANHSRPTNMIYPNGRQLNYNYTAAIDAAISRYLRCRTRRRLSKASTTSALRPWFVDHIPSPASI
jgi:hypothetical protein